VIDLPWLNRIDDAWLDQTLRGYGRVFLVEDHLPELGQSAFILAALARLGLQVRPRVYGVDGIPASGQNLEVLEHHGLSAARLAERMMADL
jgi:transketolase